MQYFLVNTSWPKQLDVATLNFAHRYHGVKRIGQYSV